MFTIPFTQDMIDRAVYRAETVPLNPIRTEVKESGSGLSNVIVAGFLAEEAIADYLGADATSESEGEDKYHYDLVLQDGTRTEVKTKRRTVSPKYHYDVSVYEKSTFQRPDLYMFVSMQYEKSYRVGEVIQYDNLLNIWLLGQKTPKDFFEKAVFWDRGDYDATNRLVLNSKTYNLLIKDLDDIGGNEWQTWI